MITKIQQSNKQLNFGRAFSSNEQKAYNSLIADAKKALDIRDTTAVIFDFNVPSQTGKNTAIGSTWSENMRNFSKFLSDMTGITSIQLQPQGKISSGNTSPYSGTNFAFGTHIIDLIFLTKPQFASLISTETITDIDKKYPSDKHTREYKTDYMYVLGNNTDNGVYEQVLKSAYHNFYYKIKNSDKDALKLNKEFINFKKENKNWLIKESLFEVLKSKHNCSNFYDWPYEDAHLFSKNIPDEKRLARINELINENKTQIDYENFKQFIAYKQQKNSREYLNSQNIKLYGDCLLGFSDSELWANRDCFKENVFYGGPDPACSDTNGIQTWNLAALDYTKLGECNNSKDITKLGETGKFLYDKYTTFFKRYDGIRMDAAWQFVAPFVYEKKDGQYKQINF